MNGKKTWRHEYALKLVREKFACVKANGTFIGSLPEESKRVVFYPINATMMCTYSPFLIKCD